MASKARELANLGNAYSDGALSNRNLIINGAMQVAQRGTSFTAGGYTLDRWRANAVSSVTQYTDASGQKWLDFTGNGNTYANVSQKIEDGLYRVRNKTIALSFDWEQVVAGSTAQVRFYNDVDLNSYVAIPNPSVAERKTITFDVGNVGNGAGGWLGVAFYNTTSTTGTGRFRLSNVQLEVGDTATPFEHRSYGQELALCQRYYYRIEQPIGGNANDGAFGTAAQYNSTLSFASVRFPVSVRAATTLSYSSLSNFQLVGGSTGTTPTALAINANTRTTAELMITSSSFGTSGQANWIRVQSGGYIAFDAEL